MIKHLTSILIVTHNHEEYIGKLLKSLEKFDYVNAFICDAASTDNTLNILMNSQLKNKVLAKTQLEGFSKNNNDLIRHFNLKTKYYLLLNPDTFFEEEFLSVLENRMEEDARIGIAAPLTKYPLGNIQTTWKRFPSFFTVLKKRLGILKATDEKQLVGPKIDWCLGSCMLITKRLIKNGQTLLDERYRLYCEDIDICFESADKKLEVVGVSDCTIYHNLNELSTKGIFSKYNRWNFISILKFILKWNYKYFSR